MTFEQLNDIRANHFIDNYDEIVFYEFNSTKPVYLSDADKNAPKNCRYCGMSAPETSFANKAHAVPQLLGNRSIISLNECDKCNADFGRRFEDALAKYLGPTRTLSRIHGKRGVPEYSHDKISIQYNQELEINIPDSAVFDNRRVSVDDEGIVKVDICSQKMIPILVAKSLIKSAYALLPFSELQYCTQTLKWIKNELQVSAVELPLLHASINGDAPFGEGSVRLLKKKTEKDFPHLWFVIEFKNQRFQTLIPFNSLDKWNQGIATNFSAYHYPLPKKIDYRKYGYPKLSMLNLAAEVPTEVVRSISFRLMEDIP